MADLFILKNPLRPFEREHYPVTGDFLHWLTSFAPQGFGVPIQVYADGAFMPVDDWEFNCDDYSVIVIAMPPAGYEAAVFVGKLILQIIIGYTIAKLLAPDPPKNPTYAEGVENTVYAITAQQNAARVGAEIPVLYGEPITTPDYASQPYTEYTSLDVGALNTGDSVPGQLKILTSITGSSIYITDIFTAVTYEVWADWGTADPEYIMTLNRLQSTIYLPTEYYNRTISLISQPTGTVLFTFYADPANTYIFAFTYESNLIDANDRQRGDGDQFLYYLLSIGLGKHSISEIYIGDLKKSDFENSDLIQTYSADYESHGDIYGYVADRFNLIYPIEQSIGLHENVFTSMEVGNQIFDNFEVGDEFPTGTAPVNRIAVDIVFDRGFYRISADGSTFNMATVTLRIQARGTTRTYAREFTLQSDAENLTPYRRTIQFNVPIDVYKVSVGRVTAATVGEDTNETEFRWAGLRAYIVTNNTICYSRTQLLAMRIKADEFISSVAQSRIRVKAKRALIRFDDLEENYTANPADIVYDIFTNTHYGGRRPDNEIDLTLLESLRTRWGNNIESAAFSGVFNGASTIYEAVRTVLAVGAAEPLPVGAELSFAYDGYKPIRAQMFTEANIVRGSLRLSYDFDKIGAYDGVQVEYRDPNTWQPAFVLFPETSINPQAINLFGCFNQTHAENYARYFWSRSRYRRTFVEFQTELEGLICRAGDRIGVTHNILSLSKSGLVERVDQSDSSIIYLDRDFEPDPGGGQLFIIFRDQQGNASTPIEITRQGEGVAQLLNPELLDVAIFDMYSDTPTHFAIGTANNVVRDFTITSIAHSGDVQVAINGVNYVDDYSDLDTWGLPYLQEALI